jgi:acetate kinase
MDILLLNAGSSSLKATLMESRTGCAVASAHADWAGGKACYRFTGINGVIHDEEIHWRSHADAVRRLVYDLHHVETIAIRPDTKLRAIGHRVVHGGEFTSAVQITPPIRARIEELVEFAPLHNPPSLNVLVAAEEAFPDVPQIAVFDTSFHTTMPPEAYTYPVPQKWTNEWGIRRYGFHGLSHDYCSRRAAELLGRPISELRLVICHLGHGCSVSAVAYGKCIDTSMGFTPLDGLMMATRSGSIDPAIITYVQQRHGLTPEQVDTILNRESGLLGVSGFTADMREIIEAINNDQPSAKLAFDIFTRRVRQTIGSFAVTMGGVDALVFTAGIGEHSAPVRETVCEGLECLGLVLHDEANHSCHPDADIATAESSGRILVIATREELSMFEAIRDVHISSSIPV